ncbi:hypothetical protein THZB04_170038 [Vibrio owensii]|nr:hypothetical protein THZB04_170038 [Vibrio owensii]
MTEIWLVLSDVIKEVACISFSYELYVYEKNSIMKAVEGYMMFGVRK